MTFPSKDKDITPLGDILPIKDLQLGGWKIEVNNLNEYYGLGPKSYQTLYFVFDENQPPKLVSRIKNKGFSFLNLLLQGDLTRLPKDLIMDRLHIAHDDENGKPCQPPSALILQQSLRINPNTLIPVHNMSFKKLKPNGPQQVVQVSDFCIFKKENTPSEVTQKVIRQPQQESEIVCEEFATDKPKSPTVPQVFADNIGEVHNCGYRPIKTAGIIPAVPFGYISRNEDDDPAWKKFMYLQ